MRDLLPKLFRSCGLAAFALACFTACSGGGGGGSPAQPQPQPLGAFAGTWDFELLVTASTDPGIPVGERERETLVITVAGTTATLNAETGNFVGTITGPRVQLVRTDGTLSLTIDANDRITGTATVAGAAGQTATFAVTAVRNQGSGNALALTTGTWSFVVDIGGSPLFFNDGQLTQNGAAVVFEFVDSTATPPITSTWTGNLTGAQWTPTVTGTLPFAVEGTFAADGRSFTGNFTSLVIGNGTITGNFVP
ncbi:MAG: hypothetical protein MUC36_16360 [Planctomycetes bacterium]|jgi:hypothetical protein|nr:hypothetical protein [Planctomycetota bacterium]